ncbi:MAG: amidohydrolase family protein, partial [Planctomycetota bacterium]
PVARAGGVLLANVSPRGRWINGQTAVMQLDGWSAREMTLTAPSGLSLTWRHMMPRDDDAKKQAKQREQKIIEFDELLDRVRRYEASREQSPETTATDLRLESLLPVVRGELPLIVQANLQAEIESAIAYTQRQGLKLILFGGYDAVKSKELLTEYDIPVLVAGTYRRPIRRDDAYDDAYTLPARLRKAGIRFAIGGHGAGSPQGSSNARNLPYHAAAAVAFGLSVDDAIRSITLSPAEIFGVADRVGSLTVGKDATIIVSDGDILQTESNVVRAFIQGRDVDLSSRHTMLFEKYRRKVAAGRSQ